MGLNPASRKNRIVFVDTVEDALIACFSDRHIFDERTVRQVGHELRELVENCVQTSLILDLTGIELISSSFLRELILIQRKCKNEGISISLCDLSENLRSVFRTTTLDRLFLVFRSREEVIQFLRKHLEVACPFKGCGGLARSTHGSSRSHAELHCARCLASFSIDMGVPNKKGAFDTTVQSIRIPTYEREYVDVDLRCQRRITVVGRLDLFAGDVLQRAWMTVPSPRQVTIDLHTTTELSDRGVEILVGLRPPTGEEGAISVELGSLHEDWLHRFPAGFPVKQQVPAISSSMPGKDRPNLRVKGRWIGSRPAGPTEV